jgi:hypothetical protein
LVAVSKTVPFERLLRAIELGITVFGENYVQEARDKFNALYAHPLSWHFIGHLQSNKAKYVVKIFDLIHSVDSLKLAREIDLTTINCLIPEVRKNPIIIHTGKFPLLTGSFQRLIIREDWALELNPTAFEVMGKVNRKYYEVCTHNALKQYVENQEKDAGIS